MASSSNSGLNYLALKMNKRKIILLAATLTSKFTVWIHCVFCTFQSIKLRHSHYENGLMFWAPDNSKTWGALIMWPLCSCKGSAKYEICIPYCLL